VPFEARLYDYLFNKERPMEITRRADGSPGDFTDNLNPNSLEVITNAWGEPAIAKGAPEEVYQFERLGYFARDPETGTHGQPVFNRTVGLRDTWGKIISRK
jgi:glutaminyl-tRNA synthetase